MNALIVAAVVAVFPLYGMWKVRTTKTSIENGWTYLPYAVERFGFFDGISRVWKWHASPTAQYQEFKRWLRRRSLIDRREKKSWSRQVYCIDRDGDFYLVECPQCHDTQGLWCHRPWDILTEAQQEAGIKEAPCDSCGGEPKRIHFHCGRCGIGIIVYTEDGLRKMRDHRDGVPPLPTHAVCDEGGKWHLGIYADAPWWWTRREVCRDYNPETGKDAHGHERYKTFPNTPQQSPGGMQCEQAQTKLGA